MSDKPLPRIEKAIESSGITIQVLERMMVLLDVLSQQSEALSLKEIAQRSQLHASTVHRILNDLAAGRYVERVDSGMYQLGMRLLELGSLVKDRLNVREVAYEHMQYLHRLTGQTINLSIQQGDDIVYVERAWSERSGMQVVRAIGGRAPLHLTSVGKLFLASIDNRQLRAYVLRTGLSGNTPNSLTKLDQLEKELVFVRRHGYARDNEELEMGVRCVSAGVYDDTAKLVAGLSISAPASRMQDDWVVALQDTAHKISEALGYESRFGKSS